MKKTILIASALLLFCNLAIPRSRLITPIGDRFEEADVVLLVRPDGDMTTTIESTHENSDFKWNKVVRSVPFLVEAVLKGSYPSSHFEHRYNWIDVLEDKNEFFTRLTLPELDISGPYNEDGSLKEVFPYQEHSSMEPTFHHYRSYMILLTETDQGLELLDGWPSILVLTPDIEETSILK